MASDWKIVIPFDADDINEAENASVEAGTTGYAASGTNTIAASTEQQWRGAYSLKITYSNTINPLITYAHTFLNKSTNYYVKARLYVPANWDGGTLSLNRTGFADGSATVIESWSSADQYATWVEVSTLVTVAADDAGSITLVASSAPTAGRYVYLDALYISLNNGLYFDGDSPRAFWKSNRHTSSSRMDYRNRKHGSLLDLQTSNYIYLSEPSGADFAPHELNNLPRALGRGAEHGSTNINQRPIIFPVTIDGRNSLLTYHANKKVLENAVKFNRTPGDQSFSMQYIGANPDNAAFIDVRTSALDIARYGYSGQGQLRLIAENPGYYEAGDRYAALTRSQSLSVAYLLGWLNESGFDDMGNSGTGQIRAQAIDVNNDLLVGGQFLNFAGNADADNIARYVRATDTWTSLFAGGANSNVNDILVLDDGRMVIVGAFTSIGGTAANRVAIWDGSTITALGSGFNGECYTVRYDYNNNYLYFGGTFTTANGVTVNRIAQYDLVAGTFGDLDSGANSDVRSIYITTNGNLLVGGDFTSIGDPGVTAYYMAYYNLSTDTWAKLTTGTSGANTGTNGAVYSITLGDNNKIYIGGNFTQVAGRDANNVAWRYFSEPSWHPMGQGLTGGLGIPVEYMVWDEVLQKLLISGRFTTAGINTVDRVVLWNGTSFERVGLDFPGDAAVYSFVRNPRNGDYFYAFDTSGTIIVPSATTTLTNNGTDDTYPVFYFVGGGSTGSAYANLLFITNLTTGARLAFEKLTINDGSTVVIDLTPGRVKVYRIIGQTLYDLTVGAFSRESDIAAFTLRPGVNMITVAAANVNGSPTITAYALWRNRHHSLSGTAA